ncbi:MAG TPA: PAS domain S-box protein, partial [Chloroflexi bacterium]|nr:PAS domain S-box protein [Chloroflexota bacterium]
LLAQVTEYDAVSILLLNEQTQTLALAASRGVKNISLIQSFIDDNTEHMLTKIPTPPGWRVISDTTDDPSWVYVLGAMNAASWIGATMRVKGRRIGILNVDSLEAGLYDEEMGQMVAVFANQAAVAIENTRLYEETRQQAEELSILHQLGQATAVTLDIDTLLQKTTDFITAKFYPNLFAFIMFDKDLTSFRVHPSARGVPDSFIGRTARLRKDSIVGQVAKTGKPYWTNDVREDDYYMEVNPLTRSEIMVPLQMRGSIIGVLNVESPELGAFSERDVKFLTTLAANVTAVIERAGLYEELQQQADQLARQVAERTAELQMERDRILAILENAGEGIVLLDSQAILLYANPAFLRQTGYEESELLQREAFMLVSPETPRKVMRDMIKTTRNGQKWSGELKNQRKDGVQYDVAVTVTPTLNKEGKVMGYVAVQSDISRFKELERLKARFISNISHDLRTPLTNIKTYISLLERGKPEKRPRYFQVLHQETGRLARLIEHLLDMSRLDAEFELDPDVTTPVKRVWKTLQTTYTELACQKGVALYWDEPADSFLAMPRLQVAERHVEKVLQQLLDNAFAYTQPGHTVIVSVGAEAKNNKEMVWFRVKDDGDGIAEEDRPFIFDRFYRGGTAREGNVPGTGLGLAIAQRIVDRYNGRIEWDSQLDQGTWFTVWLPAVWEAE